MHTALLRFLCAVVLLAGLAPGAALGQNEDQEEGEEDPQQLPEIAPREIEIRGELQLSFPSLQRQPLSGFTSPTTVPSVPDGRTPYVESYKQTLDTLPESLPAPETSSASVLSPEQPKQGLLEIGGGRYVSRFVRGRISVPLTTRQRLSANVDYTGTTGFAPFPQSSVETPADDVEGRIQFESRHGGVTVQAEVHGAADRYTLYGLPVVVQDTAASAPTRTAVSGGPAVHLRTRGTVESSVRLTYDLTQYTTQLDPTDAASTASFTEGRFGLDGTATVSLTGVETRLTLDASRSSLGGDVPSASAYNVQGGADLQLIDANRFSLRAGGRFLGFGAPFDPSVEDTPTSAASFILPSVRTEYQLRPALTVYAENTPHLSGGTLSALYADNPYAEHAPSVRPTLLTTDAAAGLRVSIGPVRVQTAAGYRYAPSYRYFAPATGTDSDSTPFQVGYDSARILHGGAELALQGLSNVEASAGLSVRDGLLVGDDDAIPYFSPVVADAMVSVSFADDRGHFQTTGTIESPRPVDRGASEEVDTYVSFDVEGAFEVTPLLDAVVRLQNVSPSAPTRWARYPRPPTSIMGGFRIHW